MTTNRFEKLFISLDDTDNLESLGTGHLAAAFARCIEKYGWGTTTFISRHQLYVHDDIPYTSHNSAMCFTAELNLAHHQALVEAGADFLLKESAPGSDPGFCVAPLSKIDGSHQLLRYSRRAKEEVLTKSEAYALAASLGIHLSEHGGTGQGVVGALAAVGLRLGGNDGRIKGKHLEGMAGKCLTVDEICQRSAVDAVWTMDYRPLKENEKVLLGEKVKSVLLQHQSVLLVVPGEDFDMTGARIDTPWVTCPRHLLQKY
ncbi:hypothetical protein [Anoxynatronum buryatiense]|uniref:tRNA(Ile2) 2-agmatinylcytidine synthetase n=1 Tax=Anoxynatronum buryatiense TaxID=489973 RepID=A0AA46AJA9_9CLOT|nr:hypothetical protein [Anoxynatronum buryatiense]SMP60060.1 tRNA(Ile2) 2-agmatinylcytidine synthetase [Anoxynatronum buryatiense]